MILRKRKLLFIIGFCAIAVLIVIFEVLARNVLDRRSELELSRQFLRSNAVAISKFGEMDSIEYTREGSRVRHSGENVSGIYAFKVTGSKTGGLVHIHWQSNPDTSAFEATAIVMPGRFADDTVIWGDAR